MMYYESGKLKYDRGAWRSMHRLLRRPPDGEWRDGKPNGKGKRYSMVNTLLMLHLPSGILGAKRTIRAPLPEAFLRVLEAKGWPLEEISEKLSPADR